jgi:PPK2 family polyphosphate:nucleotide phosphotransferase
MSIAELFQLKKNFKLKEEDASLRLLEAENGKGKSGKTDANTRDKQRTMKLAGKISQYQEILYALKEQKLLVVLQGMDTAGKDGTVRGVFGQVNPLGARTVAYKAPSAEELGHDYLWRVHKEVPAKGEMVIFNRSHYEDVLITRVHGWIDVEECERRYAHIRDFERMLAETGTVILKFFLHVSRDEQKRRLQERLDDPDKHWKFDQQDIAERAYWADYQQAYRDALIATDAPHARWHVIPADSKTQRNLAIASIVAEKLEAMKLAFPPGKPELSKLKID